LESLKEIIEKFYQEVHKVIIGQDDLITKFFLAIITDGHVLLEGVPGLAKTKTAETFSKVLDLKFSRIQFTPDLLPGDLLGTQIYNPKELDFFIKKGPIFTNFLLADEINRAPAKVQSALLQVMQEKKVTIGDETFFLDWPFLVVATQNPIEQEGTYPLPEAQVDRFMMKIKVDYPSKDEEKQIMRQYAFEKEVELNVVITKENLKKISECVENVYIDEKVEDYILEIVRKTRVMHDVISYGASPRASINMLKAVKGLAFIKGRDFVVPQDVKDIAKDILRHRIILTYEAEAKGLTTDDVINEILNSTPTP